MYSKVYTFVNFSNSRSRNRPIGEAVAQERAAAAKRGRLWPKKGQLRPREGGCGHATHCMCDKHDRMKLVSHLPAIK